MRGDTDFYSLSHRCRYDRAFAVVIFVAYKAFLAFE